MKSCIMKEGKREAEEEEEEVGEVKKAGGSKVKILLTRSELEWLMMQLKENGERKLDDVLLEIGRQREREEEREQVWKPTLESIMEVPEV